MSKNYWRWTLTVKQKAMAEPEHILSNRLMVVQKTVLRCVSSAWVLFIPRYFSYNTDVTEVSTVQGSVEVQVLLPPFIVCFSNLTACSSRFLFILLLVGCRAQLPSSPGYVSRVERGLLGSQGCPMCFQLCPANCSPWLEGRKLNAILFSKPL